MNEATLKNSPQNLSPQVKNDQIPMKRIWGMLGIRPLFSFSLLLLAAIVYHFVGNTTPINSASAWWLWFVTITNVVCILLYIRFGRKEGMNLREMYLFNRATFKGDMLWTVIAIAGSGLFAMLPATLLAQALWGEPNLPNAMLFQPLPLWTIFPLIILMPITQGLAELPTYWGYVGIRLKARGWNKWLVILMVGFVLSLQHVFFSFQLDWKYDLWLALKFLPFALWTGFIMDRRPTTLPYLMIIHLLMDAMLPVMTLMISNGTPLF